MALWLAEEEDSGRVTQAHPAAWGAWGWGTPMTARVMNAVLNHLHKQTAYQAMSLAPRPLLPQLTILVLGQADFPQI